MTPDDPRPARARRVVLGVGGGIAAYKAVSLLRLFSEDGWAVDVVPTASALRFVGAPTWAALSGNRVETDVFENVHEVPHVRLGQGADLVLVAPCTADLLAKAAHGLADDLLTNTLLTARCPVVLAPAMHTEMWQHPATVANVATLRARGVTVIEPASGRLTGKDSGPGRLPEPQDIHAAAMSVVDAAAPLTPVDTGAGPAARDAVPGAAAPSGDLHGLRVVVSAGGTREALDPVRFLGNRSSGKQGVALAETAAARGASVTLVAAHVEVPLPEQDGIEVVRVESALDLQAAMTVLADSADVVVMAAAVADFRPVDYVETKIKKSHRTAADGTEDDSAPTLQLVRNPDILAGLVRERGSRRRPLIVGFAAETGDTGHSVLELGREKLARKGCDLLVVNEVGRSVTFGQDDNTVTVLDRDGGEPVPLGPASKTVVSHGIWDVVAARGDRSWTGAGEARLPD